MYILLVENCANGFCNTGSCYVVLSGCVRLVLWFLWLLVLYLPPVVSNSSIIIVGNAVTVLKLINRTFGLSINIFLFTRNKGLSITD